jgi:dihydroxyacid dehydratase/phosphogluconate dehydratase
MLYAAGVPDTEAMAKSPHVGIASVWWEGNPCNMHLMDLAKTVKKSVVEQGMLGWQYNTIGVSDAITMGSEGELHEHQPSPQKRTPLTLARNEILPPDSRSHRR